MRRTLSGSHIPVVAHGLERTDDLDQADVLLLNTCSIREKAQEKVFSQLGIWKALKVQRPGVVIGVSPATVNRLLAVIRAIMNPARKDWGWLETIPPLRLMQEPHRRIRRLTHEEADRLIAELPEHLAAMARFTLAIGLRENNVIVLE